MGMGEVNTKIFWKLFWFWLGIIIIIVASAGCSEYNSDMRVVWSTSVQNMDDPYGDTWEEREINEPVKCREGETYYKDPYTKVEYCLPEDLTTIRNMNIYRIRNK
tara:strand:- start:574 stop:888 length:315 start_codon:yes stop_codon:yes gene_type:complete